MQLTLAHPAKGLSDKAKQAGQKQKTGHERGELSKYSHRVNLNI